MSKNTRKQKQAKNPAGPKGKSKYALKVAARVRLANKLGVSPAPLPILNMAETEPPALTEEQIAENADEEKSARRWRKWESVG